MLNEISDQRASGNVDYIVSKMAIDSKRKSEILLIQIQFCKIGRFHRFWNFFCSRATVVRQAFLSQSKNHYSLLCLRLSPFHIRIAKWLQQAKWIFICSFSNFIPLARTKWKLIVQKLIKNFQGRNGFRQPNHIGVGLHSPSLSIFCSFNHHFKTAKIRKSHCEIFSPFRWFCAMYSREAIGLLRLWLIQMNTRVANWERSIAQENHHQAIIHNMSARYFYSQVIFFVSSYSIHSK